MLRSRSLRRLYLCSLTPDHGRMEVMSANGRRVIVDRDVDVEALPDHAWSGDVAMNPFPMGSGVKVWLATGHTDMRCGFPSLALRVQGGFEA